MVRADRIVQERQHPERDSDEHSARDSQDVAPCHAATSVRRTKTMVSTISNMVGK